MIIGMLWFDNDPKTTLNAKIEKAVDYYKHKYGRKPNLCLINPNAIEPELSNVGSVAVRAHRPILPGHLWIGVEDA